MKKFTELEGGRRKGHLPKEQQCQRRKREQGHQTQQICDKTLEQSSGRKQIEVGKSSRAEKWKGVNYPQKNQKTRKKHED
jgi:hypothetical protein